MAIHAPGRDHHGPITSQNIHPASTTSNTKIHFEGDVEEKKHDEKSSEDSYLSPMEATYTSLIQQYLSLLCFENATFLAERMVAQCPTKHSFYLLATCYHRMGQVKRAYSILVNQGHYNIHAGNNRKDRFPSQEKSNDPSNKSSVAARFLLAKCCLDLGYLEEAEDCLLPRAKERFGKFSWGNAKKKKHSDNIQNTENDDLLSEWILSEPCPIPNGAAGLHLLGVICRKTHRKKQAVKYFLLSLKLDPLMWTSYESLCEMGCEESNSDINIDPVSIFGVTPPALQNIRHSQHHNTLDVEQDEFPYPGNDINSSVFGATNNTFGNDGSLMSPEINLSSTNRNQEGHNMHHLTPPPSAPIDLSYNTPIHPSAKRTHSQKKLHYTSRKYSLPAASTLFGDRSDVDASHVDTNDISAIPNIRSGGPNTNNPKRRSVMFDTPNLTPIQLHATNTSVYHPDNLDGPHTISRHANQNGESTRARLFNNDTSTIMEHHSPRQSIGNANHSAIANIASMAPPSASFHSTNTTNPLVLTQARKVVARLYYEPSPEQFTPNRNNRWSLSSQYHVPIKDNQSHTNMNLNLSQSRLSFSDESETTDIASTKKLDLSLNQTNDDPPSFSISRNKRAPIHTNLSETQSKTSGGVLGGLGGSTTKTIPDRNSEKNERIFEPMKETKDVKDVVTFDNFGVDDDCIQQILSLLCTLGASFRLLCQYQCKSALHVFHTLPASQYYTGWVQHQIGKAYFEMADYNSAKRSLEQMQSIEPHRMKGLELLSTALWHLKKEVDLCNLAQRVVDFDRLCPESWCVIGNCFSLQKEHETALQFFKRSIQLDPAFTYSHTLSGHEYVSNEDFDRAAKCYRDAIRADERHYNAWYGLGAIYFRQEKYDLAEYHFRRALSINPQSSVLHCHLGMVQYANNKPYEALDTLHGAFELDPRNAQARYQRATIYMSLDQPREALEELEKVRDAAPREASVHFAMGKVCKRLGLPERAMRCFLTALDLDPKDNNLIKAAMDRLNEVDVEEDVSAF